MSQGYFIIRFQGVARVLLPLVACAKLSIKFSYSMETYVVFKWSGGEGWGGGKVERWRDRMT